MAQLTLTRRNSQLALLARACEHGRPGRVTIRSEVDDAYCANTRLLVLARDALFIAWPDQPLTPAERRGAMAEVHFDLDDEHYALVARTCGRRERDINGRGRVATLELSVPLRVERRQRRRDVRMPLNRMQPIEARLTAMLDPDLQVALRLTDLSRGGAAGVTNCPTCSDLRIGNPFWMEFTLPDDPQPFELAVRLVRRRAAQDGAGTILGCGFCPHDDPRAHEQSLDRLEQFVARQR